MVAFERRVAGLMLLSILAITIVNTNGQQLTKDDLVEGFHIRQKRDIGGNNAGARMNGNPVPNNVNQNGYVPNNLGNRGNDGGILNRQANQIFVPNKNLDNLANPQNPGFNNPQPVLQNDNLKFKGGNKKFGMGNDNMNQDMGQARMRKNRKQQIRISDTEECGEEVRKYCTRNIWEKNFMVLDCLQNDLKMDEELGKECQHFLWVYKRNLTTDERFDHAAKEMCKNDLSLLAECRNLERGKGQVIPCLIEYFDNVTSSACRQFLNKMATIVFSDYRLIYKFAEDCISDIQKFHCGRMEGDDDEMIHSQGRTLSCLAEKMTQLDGKCKLQVLRTYELQSDDFHLDRPLFYACRDDRERFCPSITAGGGKVYKCLAKHVVEKTMSAECREKLELREKLMAEDVKVEKSFFKACKRDIENYDCITGSGMNEDAKRASVLLCLENAMKRGKKLKGKCLAEMEDVRAMIMEDYKISPDLVAKCADDIDRLCPDKEIGGETLHCLMEHAKAKSPRSKISTPCKAQVEDLLREADVGSDYRLDHSLQRACQSVVDKVCDDVPKGEGGVINCLMENIDSDEMTDRCEERLLEIQYFIVRDFRLDSHLYKSCKTEAVKLCNADQNWYKKSMNTQNDPSMVLSCLHRNMMQPEPNSEIQVSRACKKEVKRVMKAQALSVELNPEIQRACLKDLGNFCSEDKTDTEIGAEMACLQNNYDSLEEECKKAVGELIEEEDEDYELDHILMKACTPMIKKFCEDLLESDSDPADVLECLIEHKHSRGMDSKCAAGVEHHQIISQKEFKFNHKFKEACQESVKSYCMKAKTKPEVVSCLSEHIRNDTLLEERHRIDKPCRHQLKQQILQRAENIKLDPELQRECSLDIKSFCHEVSPGNGAIIECLKSKQKDLSRSCHMLLFRREKDEFVIADYGLLTACKKMIKEYCEDIDDEPSVFRCLKKHRNNPNFDTKCGNVVTRREVMQSQDYRLNPSLKKACRLDIGKFCSNVVEKHKEDPELEGKVIHCLKKQFAVKRLSRDCDKEIEEVVKQAAGDINEAPVLEKACIDDIYTLCKEFVMNKGNKKHMNIVEAGKGGVEECLKEQFRLKRIKSKECMKEVSFLIQEEEVDINVDPILKTGCERELNKLCRGVRSGEGRLMSCLLSILEDDPRSLTSKCKTLLEKRKEMWEYAAQVAPIEGFQEIYTQIKESPAQFYILGVLSAVVCMIFIFGLGCGRITKRVRAEMKNK